MNKPLWIIENITSEPSYLELAKVVEELGYPIIKLNGDYIRKEIQKYNEFIGPIIVVASIEINKLLQEDIYRAYSFATFNNYKCTSYYPKLGQYLFNDSYSMLQLCELSRQKWHFYKVYGREACIYCRPNSPDKPFKAGLIDLQDFDKFCSDFEHLNEEIVIISNPKNIIGEWRVVVNDEKEIIAYSSYRYNGLTTRVPSIPREGAEFVNKILNVGYFPDPIFCIDVAQDSDGEFWLMELTSFSSAGLYATNKKNIVEKVSEKVWKLYNV